MAELDLNKKALKIEKHKWKQKKLNFKLCKKLFTGMSPHLENLVHYQFFNEDHRECRVCIYKSLVDMPDLQNFWFSSICFN